MEPLLRACELCAGYGVADILREVSFAPERSEVCALLGENGSGKTTLLRVVCGLLRYRCVSTGCGPDIARIPG